MTFSFSILWALFSGKIKGLISFVIKHWKFFLVLGLCAAIYIQHEMIQSRDLKIVELTGKLEKCADANEMLSNTLENRNDEIAQWKEVSDKLREQNEELTTKITDIRKETQELAENILEGPKPGSCEESIKYLVDGVKDLKW